MRIVFLAATTFVALGSAAFAADAGRPAPAFDWSGFYVGVNGGYGANGASVGFTPNDPNAYYGSCSGLNFATCPPGASADIRGGLAGAQVGYNYQAGPNWVIGAEADYDWSGARGSTTSTFFLGSTGLMAFAAKQSIESFGTVRARLGYVPVSPLMIYATGGLAIGAVHESAPMLPAEFGAGGADSGFGGPYGYDCELGTAICFAGSSSKVSAGWTLGAGGEYAITSNLTFKAEYLYVDLGRASGVDSVALNAAGAANPSSFTAKFSAASLNVVRAGLNWKF